MFFLPLWLLALLLLSPSMRGLQVLFKLLHNGVEEEIAVLGIIQFLNARQNLVELFFCVDIFRIQVVVALSPRVEELPDFCRRVDIRIVVPRSLPVLYRRLFPQRLPVLMTGVAEGVWKPRTVLRRLSCCAEHSKSGLQL